MAEFWRTKTFKVLLITWNQRLEQTGFEDAEIELKGDRALKQRSTNAYRQATQLERESRLEYYTFLGHLVHNTKFPSELERLVMLRHSEGASIKEICEEILHCGLTRDRKTIRHISQTMANEMGHQKLEPKTNESQEVDSYKFKQFFGPQLPNEFKNLIIAPFLNSLRYGNDMFKLIDKEAYFGAYSKYVELLLQRPNCIINLAMLDDDTVIGWSMVENNIVHYVWVKKEVRHQGVGRSLMPKEFDTISHITNKGMNIWVNKFPSVRFNPFI